MSRETVFELQELQIEEEQEPVEKHYRCPICQTEQPIEILEERKPCPNCKFIHMPNMSDEQLSRIRIRWEEWQVLQERNKVTRRDEEQLRRDQEMRLRQQIRAELKKEMQTEKVGKAMNKQQKVALGGVAFMLLAGSFVSGFFVNEKLEPPVKKMTLTHEQAVAMAKEILSSKDSPAAENGIELSPDQANAIAEGVLNAQNSSASDAVNGAIPAEMSDDGKAVFTANHRLCPLPYDGYALIPLKVPVPTCSL